MFLFQLGLSSHISNLTGGLVCSYLAEGISIYSQNCRGLNAIDKRRDVFHYVRHKKYDIICLQDVHLEKSMETYIQREWGYDIHMSPFLSNRRGVFTLINNTFEYNAGIVKKDPNCEPLTVKSGRT